MKGCGEPAVTVVPGELRPVAKILEIGQAVPARAVCPPEPRDADTAIFPDDLGHDHVPEHEGELRLRQLPVDNVEIGPADSAGTDPQVQLAVAGLRLRYFGGSQRLARSIQEHRAHG